MKAIAHIHDKAAGEHTYKLLPDIQAINDLYNHFRETHEHYKVTSGSRPYEETWRAYDDALAAALPIDRATIVVKIEPEGTFYYDKYLKRL